MAQKIAVVTGARRGIGLGIARALAKEGYYVVLSAFSPEADEAVEAVGSGCYIPCNIADTKARAAFAEALTRRFERVDVWVNNAGVAPKERLDLLSTTEDNYDYVMDVNCKGTFFMCQTAANLMLQMQKKGLEDYHPRIINISSISAYAVSVSRGEYCVAKAGISMITQLFAARLAGEGILVFEVRPGIIDTDMIAKVKGKYDALIADGLLPLPRLGTPEDVANCVVAACSGHLDYAAGQILNADGGFSLRIL